MRHTRYDSGNTGKQASTSIFFKEGDNTNPSLLTARPTRTYSTDALAIKLNSFWEKSAKYNSHKEFLSCFIPEKLIPKALEITFESTTRNYDQEINN